MMLQMKRGALKKLNRNSKENQPGFDTEKVNCWDFDNGFPRRSILGPICAPATVPDFRKWLKIKKAFLDGAVNSAGQSGCVTSNSVHSKAL
jgi:hypothetical protein